MKSVATFSWQELLAVTGGEAVSHHRAFEEAAVDTDTRTLAQGSFFVPLTGENFDGNTYIEKAFEQGAEGTFVSSSYINTHPELKRFPNMISVEEPLLAYLALARYHRKRVDLKVVGVTGSSGKTTVKEMLYALLSTVLEGRVQKTEKNYNNEVGVALTLLNVQPETEVLVLEMAMRGLGQIALLTEHALPDIAIITNIGPAHIGILGSMDAIAQAKCEIFTGMDEQTGLGIINGDDPLLVQHSNLCWNGRMESFSLHEVDEIHTKPEGSLTFNYEDITFALGLPGSHNVMNALAGIKACEALGFPLKKVAHALAHFEAGGGRWQKSPVEGMDNLWIINDAYNANPASVKVALGAFMDGPQPGLQKVAIIGGMAELGEFSELYHREIGEWISTRGGLDGLIVIGDEAKPLADAILPNSLQAFRIQENSEAVALIQQYWPQNAIFFLKGSRAFHLEEIADLLKQQAASSHAVS